MLASATATLLRSSRAKSGFQYVIYDGRPSARRRPWSVTYRGYRSAGFAQPIDAAKHVVEYLAKQHVTSKATHVRKKMRRICAPPKKTQRVKASSMRKTTKARGRRSRIQAAVVANTARGSPAPAVVPTPVAAPSGRPSDWMTGKTFAWKNALDLFGQRIEMDRKDKGVMKGVIKHFQPCSAAPFGVVFDDEPDRVYDEDLLRRGRDDWRVVAWEADLFSTSHVRPMCPTCGHPLESGADAWTRCVPCGHMEPGAYSTEVFRRTRSDDPYRRNRVSYAEVDEDEEE